MQKLQFSYDELNEREQLPTDWKQGNMDMGFQRALFNVSDYVIMPLVGRPLYAALLADNLRNILTWNTGDTALVNDIRFYQNAYYRAKVNTSNVPTNTTDWEASQMGFLYNEKLKPLMSFAVALEGLKGRGATFNSNNLTSIVPEQAVRSAMEDANRKVALLEGRRDLALDAFMAQLAEWNSTIDGVVYQLPSSGYRVSRCRNCACNYYNGYYECGGNNDNQNRSFQYITNNNWQQTRK
jgi:hypothetical protein